MGWGSAPLTSGGFGHKASYRSAAPFLTCKTGTEIRARVPGAVITLTNLQTHRLVSLRKMAGRKMLMDYKPVLILEAEGLGEGMMN